MSRKRRHFFRQSSVDCPCLNFERMSDACPLELMNARSKDEGRRLALVAAWGDAYSFDAHLRFTRLFCGNLCKGRLRQSGIPNDFVQDNQSVSFSAGTVRGLHFQIPPFQQAKLIRVCVEGSLMSSLICGIRPLPTVLTSVSNLVLKAANSFSCQLASLTVSALWFPRPKFFIRSMPCTRLPMTAELIGSIRR